MNSRLMKYEQLSTLQRDQLLDIEVKDEQKALVGDIHGVLHALSAKPESDIQGYALLVGTVPRGVFILKRRTLLPPWADGNTATFHALMIDHRYQGLGLGKLCMRMFPSLARELWPQIDEWALAVAPTNRAAHSLYRAAGWRDWGDADHASTSFEQRMLLTLV